MTVFRNVLASLAPFCCSLRGKPRREFSLSRRSARAGKRSRAGEAGFTLIELLVVLVILALLASLVGPRILQYVGSSRTKVAKVQIESLGNSLELFKLDIGRYPSTAEGLQALVTNPSSVPGWSGPYLKNGVLPKDPWGNPYVYRTPGPRTEFEILSLGSDKQPGGTGEAEDVKNW